MLPERPTLQSVGPNEEMSLRSSPFSKLTDSGKLEPCNPPGEPLGPEESIRVFGPRAPSTFIPCKRSETNKESSIDDYFISREIGHGAFARVKLVYHRYSRQCFAAKIYSKNSDSMNVEIRILRQLNHPNIVKLHSVIESKTQIYLMLEYLNGISLKQYLRQLPGRRCNEKQARHIFKGLVSAVEYCHSINVCHRDIKLENVIVDRTNTVKLIDFGFSTCLPSHTKVKMFCGTVNYMAAEIIQKREFEGPPADIWACGILLFALLCGSFPFKAAFDKEIMLRIHKGIFTLPEHLPAPARRLINSMLHPDPTQRPTAAQVLADSWLQNERSGGSDAKFLDVCKFRRTKRRVFHSFIED